MLFRILIKFFICVFQLEFFRVLYSLSFLLVYIHIFYRRPCEPNLGSCVTLGMVGDISLFITTIAIYVYLDMYKNLFQAPSIIKCGVYHVWFSLKLICQCLLILDNFQHVYLILNIHNSAK